MSNRYKIKLAKLSMPCFVLGTSLFITLILNTSCPGFHNILTFLQLMFGLNLSLLVCFLMVILLCNILAFLGCLKQT